MAMIPASIGPAMTTASGSIAVINVTPTKSGTNHGALSVDDLATGLSLGPTAVALPRIMSSESGDDRLVHQLRGDCLITVFSHHVMALS